MSHFKLDDNNEVNKSCDPVEVVFFLSHSSGRVILGQVLSIVTYGTRTHTEVTACD